MCLGTWNTNFILILFEYYLLSLILYKGFDRFVFDFRVFTRLRKAVRRAFTEALCSARSALVFFDPFSARALDSLANLVDMMIRAVRIRSR